MSVRDPQLAAYLATLATLAFVFVAALVVAAVAPALIGKIEAFGLGTITGGLIGVLRLPQPRTSMHQPPAGPAAEKEGTP